MPLHIFSSVFTSQFRYHVPYNLTLGRLDKSMLTLKKITNQNIFAAMEEVKGTFTTGLDVVPR